MCQEQQLPVAGSRTRASRNPTVAYDAKARNSSRSTHLGTKGGKENGKQSIRTGEKMWQWYEDVGRSVEGRAL
jgi:hypothetical protein